MSDLTKKIEALAKTGEWLLKNDSPQLELAALKSEYKNPWFTAENIQLSIQSIAENFLNKSKLDNWLADYEVKNPSHQKTIGLIMAGNLPLVGFHDFLIVYISGHKAQIKLSSKDEYLLPCIVSKLAELDSEVSQHIFFVDKITGVDAAIATGSGNSARYFEYYFRGIPHIIRKNRHSVAVVNGEETDEELIGLGKDIFQYFGLGCRSVSALFVPENYSFKRMMELFKDQWLYLMDHSKYRNNYEYNLACAMLDNKKQIVGDSVLLFEETSNISRIACLHYQHYVNLLEVNKSLMVRKNELQCIATTTKLNKNLKALQVPFGNAQQPELSDYADGVNTLKFLVSL